MSNLVTYLHWAPIFEYYVVWFGSNNEYHRGIVCFKAIGLHAQNTTTILGSMVNMIGGTYNIWSFNEHNLTLIIFAKSFKEGRNCWFDHLQAHCVSEPIFESWVQSFGTSSSHLSNVERFFRIQKGCTTFRHESWIGLQKASLAPPILVGWARKSVLIARHHSLWMIL